MAKARTRETPPRHPAPRANPRLLGQDVAESILLAAETSGRLPHSWLLVGPEGIGKATLAYRFARYLLAQGPAGGDSGLFGGAAPAPRNSLAVPPDDPVFARVAAGAHPDLMSLSPEGGETAGAGREIRVTEVRAAGRFLRMTAAEGGWRILIVDPADALNRNAANALLKILEEPPAQSLILLISHAPDRLPATLRSRCCRLRLAPLGGEILEGLIADYGPEGAGEGSAALISLAEGSIGRALALERAGATGLYQDLLALLGGLPKLDVERLHAYADSLARDTTGVNYGIATDLLLGCLRRLALGAGGGRLPPPASPAEGELVRRLQPERSLAQWLALWEKISALVEQAERARLDRRQVTLSALLALGEGGN